MVISDGVFTDEIDFVTRICLRGTTQRGLPRGKLLTWDSQSGRLVIFDAHPDSEIALSYEHARQFAELLMSLTDPDLRELQRSKPSGMRRIGDVA